MAFSVPTDFDHTGGRDTAYVRGQLDGARRFYYEQPARALAAAIHCHEVARSLGDDGLRARACALQAAVSLHRGDLRGALGLAVEAEWHAESCDDVTARAEVAAVKAQLSFFTGSYTEALRHAEAAVQLADETQDAELRIFALRITCPVFGNVGVADLKERIDTLLELTIETGNRWEEALSRNDLACFHQEQGDLEEAGREIERAIEAAHSVTSANTFALGVIHSSRADIRLLLGRPREALEDAERAIALLTDGGDPNPYVLGVTVRADVEARMTLGALEDAQRFGEGALDWLGDRVPQTRSLILTTLATTLRAAGRVDEAYDALARAAELERQAFRELSDLQLRLERAEFEASAARSASDQLAAKNRQLEDAHNELAHRTTELEQLQDQLRDQAERDWLTGLHNRRYLAGELRRLADEQLECPFSLAVIDLDHFKSINDRFGHGTGDDVLVRVATLLSAALRQSDVIVRSGGEEFIALMPLTEPHAARACCERIRCAIRDEPWDSLADGLALTTSVGVASTDGPDDLEALIRQADARLYEAKRSGRDCVVSETPAAE